MLGDGQEIIVTWLAEYGLLALLLVMVLEGAMLLYIAPSESLVPLAIASPVADGAVEYGLVIAVAVVGATAGQTVLLVVSHRVGREWLLERRWFRIDEKYVQRFEGWFDRWGPIAIPISNALPFTRGMLTIPAGVSGMDVKLFAFLSAVGTLVFQSALAVLTLGVLEAV